MYTLSTVTTVNVTNDANETFRECLGISIKVKNACTQVFKRAYKQCHKHHHSVTARNIIETFKGAN